MLTSLFLAGALGTLPTDIYRVCFLRDLSSECYERVSGFDTISICRDNPSEPWGNVVYVPFVTVGFTNPQTGVFEHVDSENTVARFQTNDTLYIVVDEEAVFNPDGFEYCATYRT